MAYRLLAIAVLCSLTLLTTPGVSAGEGTKKRLANDGNVVLEGIPEIPETLGRQLNRYQNVRGAGFQDWTADGQGIYITTRFGVLSQLHLVQMPAEPAGS